MSPVPVIGVIEPSVEHLVRASAGRIAVLATPVTIASGVYGRQLKKRRPMMMVWEKGCPAFVPLIEQGLANSPAADALVEATLANMPQVDTIQLGCTHYVMLQSVIQKLVGPKVRIVNAAGPTAMEVERVLKYLGLLRTGNGLNEDGFFFTKFTPNLMFNAQQIFGRSIDGRSHRLRLHTLEQSPRLLCSANQCPVLRT